MAYFDVDRRQAGTMAGASLTGSIGAAPGEKAAGEYIVSGAPFVTGSTSTHDDGEVYEIKFPRVTSWFQFENGTGAAKIGFSSGGIGGQQYFTVAASTTTQVYHIEPKACLSIQLVMAGV